MMTSVNSSLEAALDLGRQGIPCFPCLPSKAPATAHGFKDASTDAAVIREHFHRRPRALIGVPTDESSGLNVLDIDARHGGDQWYAANRHRLLVTRVHRTRSGGLHLLFCHLRGLRSSTGRIAAGVDVRGAGGYVIWWPAAGLPILCDAEPAMWPIWLRRRSQVSAAPRPHRIVVPTSPALHGLVRTVAAAEPGERNRLTFWAACRAGEMVASGYLSAEAAASVIAEAGARAGLPLAEATRTAWSGIRTAGGRRHA